LHQYKIQNTNYIKYRLDWTGLGHGLQTGNLEPTKYNLFYQAIPEKLIKVDFFSGGKTYSDSSYIFSGCQILPTPKIYAPGEPPDL